MPYREALVRSVEDFLRPYRGQVKVLCIIAWVLRRPCRGPVDDLLKSCKEACVRPGWKPVEVL